METFTRLPINRIQVQPRGLVRERLGVLNVYFISHIAEIECFVIFLSGVVVLLHSPVQMWTPSHVVSVTFSPV